MKKIFFLFGLYLLSTSTTWSQTYTPSLIAPDTIKACGDSVLVSASIGMLSYTWSNGKTTSSIFTKTTGWHALVASTASGSIKDSVFVSIVKASILQNDTSLCAPANLKFCIDTSTNGWNNQIYFNDFENGSLSNLTNGVIDTFNGTKILGRFSTELIKLKLQNLPPHDSVTFDFDLLIHDSWDGINDPDLWKLIIDNNIVYNTCFNNHSGQSQSYPGNYPTSTYPSMTGAFATNLPRACFGGTYVATSLYKIRKIFTHSLDSISIIFKGDVSQDPCDESWSLDNLKVAIKNKFSILWSTGDTTAKINVTPTQTTNYWVKVSNGITTCTDTVKVVIASNYLASLIPQDTIKACGDSILVTASSGMNSYLWNTGKTTSAIYAKTSGWYKVTVLNLLGCTNTDSVYVNILKVSGTPKDTTICQGASVNLSANASASFVWSTGATTSSIIVTPSATTKYWVKVSNAISACVDTLKVQVVAPPAPPTVTNVMYCINATANALTATAAAGCTLRWYGTNASGGTASLVPPTPSTLSLGTTTYYVSQVNYLGCESARAALNVVVKAYPDAQISTSSSMIICNGQGAILQVNPGVNYTYQWSLNGYAINGATSNTYLATIGANYTVSVTNGTCSTVSSPITITVNSNPTAIIHWNGTQLFSPISFYAYQWYLNGLLIPGAIQQYYTPLQLGTYYVLVANEQGCKNASPNYNLLNLSVGGINTVSLNIYPNPTKGIVQFPNLDAAQIRVYNALGQLLHTFENTHIIDMSSVPAGVYLLRVYNVANELIAMERIVKED